MGGRMTSVELINVHISNHFSHQSHVLVADSQIFTFTWSRNTCKSCANMFISRQCSRKKKRSYERLCYSLDHKCVDKMHLCTYYNSPPFRGKCKYPSSQHCCCIFWIVSRKNIHRVYFLPSCPIACPPLLHCSRHTPDCGMHSAS